MHETSRLLEEAADELGRLEAAASAAPSGVAVALRLAAIAHLVTLDASGEPLTAFALLAAADGDPMHDLRLPSSALHWRALLPSEERRVRGGAPLTSQRFAIVAPTLATYSDRARLEAIWREAGLSRPVLRRALDAAAWSPTPALGEACAALMLCAGGRTDLVRFLPFADIPAATRSAAIDAWRTGDEEPWAQVGLAAVARSARALRSTLERIRLDGIGSAARIAALGRAAITARRVFAVMQERFVITMPSLAEALELSRPAVTDALDRLAAEGIAREITGRARDRVHAWDAACAVGERATGP